MSERKFSHGKRRANPVEREQAHLVGPTELALLITEGVMVLLRDDVASLEHDEPAVVVTARVEVDETLDTAEAGSASMRVSSSVLMTYSLLSITSRDPDPDEPKA